MAMARADNVFLLAQGRNVIQGPAVEIRHRAEVARILVG
jgi:ABC-type branched-subunit amino acid transport system ATPase component